MPLLSKGDNLSINDTFLWRTIVFTILGASKTYEDVEIMIKRMMRGYQKGKDGKHSCLSDDTDDWEGSSPIVTFPWLPIVIKRSERLRLEEAHSMLYARELLKDTEVKVPRVYSAFEKDGYQYIVMEKIDGGRLKEMWKKLGKEKQENVIRLLREAVNLLRKNISEGVHDIKWGPVYHLALPVSLGNDDGLGPYKTVNEFNQYLCRTHLKSRFFRANRKEAELFLDIFLSSEWCKTSTVFTHGDLSPYNIMLDKHGKVSIIDWETAGWWPSFMEYYLTNRYQNFWQYHGIILDSWIPCKQSESEMIKTFFHFHKSI